MKVVAAVAVVVAAAAAAAATCGCLLRMDEREQNDPKDGSIFPYFLEEQTERIGWKTDTEWHGSVHKHPCLRVSLLFSPKSL